MLLLFNDGWMDNNFSFHFHLWLLITLGEWFGLFVCWVYVAIQWKCATDCVCKKYVNANRDNANGDRCFCLFSVDVYIVCKEKPMLIRILLKTQNLPTWSKKWKLCSGVQMSAERRWARLLSDNHAKQTWAARSSNRELINTFLSERQQHRGHAELG